MTRRTGVRRLLPAGVRRLLPALALALLLVTAGCLGSTAAAAPTGAADGDEPPTVSVSAAGSVAVEPDLAVVTVAVESTADSADAARARVADDVVAVRAALAELGLEDDAVTTAAFHLQPEYDHAGETPELVGYRAVHVLTVEAGVDEAGAVVDAAVGAGADRVQGVRFTLTDETRQSAREEALGAAVDNAATDAGAIADGAGLTLDGVRSASTGAPTVVPYDGRVATADDAAGGRTVIESGPVTVTAHVSVVYAAS